MHEVYAEKKVFATQELARCLRAACPEVALVEYRLQDTENSAPEESVIIRFQDGFYKTVSVSADSLMAMARDVFAAID
jgi:hypothetical protein